MRTWAIFVAVVVYAAGATPALAQRLPFELSFDVSGPSILDVSTVRGSVSKRRVTGEIGACGPLVRATSRSGAVRITVGLRGRSSRSSPITPGNRGQGDVVAFARDRTLSYQLAFKASDGLWDR
jgi:hypothetical protein